MEELFEAFHVLYTEDITLVRIQIQLSGAYKPYKTKMPRHHVEAISLF